MTVVYDAKNEKLIYDRKLRDGCGTDMYGLEVCKSMFLPNDFMERCYEIREKYNKTNILNAVKSRYNSSKIKTICKICKKKQADHFHHLYYQNEANKNGYITSFHKDHSANLISVCEECHHNIHSNNKKYKYVTTSSGMELIEVE